MGLSHLKLKTADVEVSEGEHFTVRGLGFTDIVEIFQADSEQLSKLFNEILVGPDGKVVLGDMTTFVFALANTAPRVAANIISVASDEQDWSIAQRFSFPVVLDALEKIGTLTFASEGGAKKVMETVIRLVKGASALASR